MVLSKPWLRETTINMEKILDFIMKKGNGNYLCYKTSKVNLDKTDSEILDYDDKPASSNKKSLFAESDTSRVHTVKIDNTLVECCRPIFTYFLDGSRHVYKVDDIAIGKKIYPILAGQIVVGCCERIDRDTFKPYGCIEPEIVISFPEDFDLDDDGDDFCRLYCEEINKVLKNNPYVAGNGLKINKILLYKTDKRTATKNDKDDYKNRGTAKIQMMMTDEEQHLVAELCSKNKLDDEHYLIKDGSLEYNPSYSSKDKGIFLRENYRYVVGISKSFDPELIPDYEGNKLSKTIAGLAPFERTKTYRYKSEINDVQYAVWYLRIRNSRGFCETNFSDIIKCEMVLINDDDQLDTDLINMISANLINEAYPVCYGNDTRWANHLYPVYLTETFCKSKYYSNDVILNLF